MQMAMNRGGFQSQANRYYGKYRGTVKDVNDPESRGRIRAHVPEIGIDVSPYWAEPCVPYAGNGVGQFTVPPLESGVWIEFEAGDVSRPIWTGCWWGKGQLPKDNEGAEATPSIKTIRSERGLMVTMNDSSQTIHVSDEKGQNMLEIDIQQRKITIKGASKAVVEAPQIELVENATHPVVFGDQLLQYLNQLVIWCQTHMHPGELALGVFPVTPAPPAPPPQMPTPSILSKKVKTG